MRKMLSCGLGKWRKSSYAASGFPVFWFGIVKCDKLECNLSFDSKLSQKTLLKPFGNVFRTRKEQYHDTGA
jgi:hypothetical protein